MTGSGDVLQFGEFRLDLRRMGVWKEDQPVPLEPKALDVLRHLVTHRDRLVTKDELLDAVWKDTFVTPNALTRAVAQLRKGLGDDVDRPRLIETVARRGYRFVAPVVVVPNGDRAVAANVASPVPAAPALAPSAAARALPAIPARAALSGPSFRAVVLAATLVVAIAAVLWWTARSRAALNARTAPAEIAPVTAYGDVIDAVVAPDGKYIAYVRSTPRGQSLWIRQLRGTNAIELVPAAPVSYYGITFAPDSSSIYYVVRGPEPLAYPTGMLFNIPALGGLPRRLGTPFDHHPSVSPDGRRLASLRSDYPKPGQSALLVTNAEGADARALLVVDEPDQLAPGFFISPSWSPSGDRLAVTIRNYEARSGRVLIVDVATGAVRRFDREFGTATFTSWMPDGSGIVFVAADHKDVPVEFGSRIWFQPLPDGPPRPITTGLVDYRNVTISSDGASLLSVGSLNNASIWTVPVAGGERVQKIPSMKDDGVGGIAWLDRRTIVFASPDGGSLQLWAMNVDGSNRRQLTADGWNVLPRPTRDGQTIFFVSDRGGRSSIWRVNRDGSGARQLALAAEPHDLGLTSDERTITFTASGPDRVDSTWSVPVAGGNPTLLVKGLTHASVSPDGRSIAGVLQESRTATPALVIFPMGAAGPPKTFDAPVSVMNSGGVWWSRDGRAVLYTTADRMNVWRQPIGGGPAVPVTEFADGSLIRGDLSEDGRSLLICRGLTFRDAFLITGFR